MAQRLGCEAVVTVGSAAEAVPHTRTPQVTGSTTDADLARRLGIGQPSYQGVTGVVGVIQTDLAAAGIPSVSLRVGIPHYLMNAEHPQAVAALQTHLAHVLNVDPPEQDDDFADEVRKWRSLHDEVADGDVQLQMYVKMLEHDFDQRAEAAIPSADDLGAQFEDFLREQTRRRLTPLTFEPEGRTRAKHRSDAPRTLGRGRRGCRRSTRGRH